MTDREDLAAEHELHDLLERSVDHLHPSATLLEDARRDGRRLVRTRRRNLSVAAVAAAAALAVALPVGLRGAAPRSGSVPAQGVAAAPSPTPTASTTDEGRFLFTVTTEGKSYRGPDLSLQLEDLAPQGTMVLDPFVMRGGAADGYVPVEARVLRPGVGSGTVRLTQTPSDRPLTCRGGLGAAASCTVLIDSATGTVVGTRTSAAYGDLTINRVSMVLAAGGSTTVTVANTEDERVGPRSRPVGSVAPLSLDELVEAVAEGTGADVGP